MKLHKESRSGTYHIDAYDAEFFVINDTRVSGSVVVTPHQLLRDWSPERVDDLDAESLYPVLELAPEVVLLGTGRTQRFPDPSLFAMLAEHHVGMEVMDTPAACRTYNILVADGRTVAAILFPPAL